MANKVKIEVGQKWYIANDLDGECEIVTIMDITPNTVKLERMIDGELQSKRYATTFEFINFVEQVEERTYH